jgi:hypothetical protein
MHLGGPRIELFFLLGGRGWECWILVVPIKFSNGLLTCSPSSQ